MIFKKNVILLSVLIGFLMLGELFCRLTWLVFYQQ